MNHPIMHVLILPSWYPMHYAPTRGIFFKEQVQALNEQGVRTGVIYPNFRGLRTFEFSSEVVRDHFQTTVRVEDGIPVYRFHGWNPKIGRLRLWAFRYQSRRLMQKYVEQFGVPDLIHAHSALWGGVAARDLAKEYSLPYVITEHSSAFLRGKIEEWQKPHIGKSFEDADAVWAVSSAFKRELQPFAGNAEIDVMPNMVDVTFFQLPPSPRTVEPFTFLSVGSLSHNKGIDLLLKAFARLNDFEPNVELEIGGAGSAEENLRNLAHDLGIGEKVRFLGGLSREEVLDAMWRANALVSSSYVETFGVVLIEAMATGLPVVATESGGPGDIVRSGVGRLVPKGNVRALSEAMGQTKEAQVNENKIRKYVIDTYSAEMVTRRLKTNYQLIVRGDYG